MLQKHINLKRFGKLLARKVSDKHKSRILPISLEHLSKEDADVYRSEAKSAQPEMLPLLLMLMETGRFVSVGDPDQLGAVVCQEYLRQTQFDRSLMARALHIPGMEVELLTLNYRSHPSIFLFLQSIYMVVRCL